MVLAFPIGWTISLVLLGLIYYGLFLPIGLAFRLVGPRCFTTPTPTGRIDLLDPAHGPADVRRYFRQF